MTNTRIFGTALALVLLAGNAIAQEAAMPKAMKPEATTAAQSQVDILLDTIRANRKALVAANMNLTDDQAKAFWPVYEKYQGELATNQDKVVALIDDYTKSFSDMSDDKAMKLSQDYLGLENDRVQLRKTYLPEFAKVLPGRSVARLFQLENKMDAIVRYELAGDIPVLDERAAAPAEKSGMK